VGSQMQTFFAIDQWDPSSPFQFDTLLLGDTSTKVLFRPLPCISTLVLYEGGTSSPLSPNRICPDSY
jgi:hypothetical protein